MTADYDESKSIRLVRQGQPLEFGSSDSDHDGISDADEIAQAVLFLAGDGGSYITGQTLHVNGGMYTV